MHTPSRQRDESSRWRMATRAWVGLALLALCGCGPEGADPSLMSESGALEVGYFDKAVFYPLTDGDPLRLVDGIQGGTWIMPGLRAEGLDLRVEVSGELRVDDEPIGWLVPGPLLLAEGPDGWLEVTELAMPVPDPADGRAAFSAYDGAAAIFHLMLRDEAGRMAEVTRQVRLINR